MKGGLTRRILVGGGLLAVVIGAAFAVLLSSVADLRQLEQRARQSEEVLVVANRLERLIVDLETGERGFLLTGSEQLLQPWQAARAAFPQQVATLENLVAGNAEQAARVQRIAQGGASYLREYSEPLVAAARRDRAAVNIVAVAEDGKRRVDALRAEFDELLGAEYRLAATRQGAADQAANRAIVATVAGLVVSVVLVGLFTWYLNRGIVRPVRRVVAMTGRLAAGNLDARVPEDGVGEVGVLARDFNAMASTLEAGRRELAGSRARVVAAADRARQRIERDLHDGTQQRLVSLVLQLRAAEAAVPAEQPQLRAQLTAAAEELTAALDELRELSRGIHPAILSEGGLRPALKALARRSPVPVELSVDVPVRPPQAVEAGVYYAVSEALTNAARHASASAVWIDVRTGDGRLRVSVRDDGVGGAAMGSGSGLIGLRDRIEALDGTITLTSPPGGGTTLVFDLPSS